MTKPRAALTELEGAILGVLRRAPGSSPYAVRKVFLNSRSAEWSGSAGAVYPAIARLAKRGLLKRSEGGDRRGTATYALGVVGLRAHDRWLADAARACGIGIDPFRTRVALWPLLTPPARRALMRRLKAETERARDAVARALPSLPREDAATDGLLLALLDARLSWLRTNG